MSTSTKPLGREPDAPKLDPSQDGERRDRRGRRLRRRGDRNGGLEPSDKVVVHEPPRRLSLRFVSLRTHIEMAAHFGHNYVKKYYMGTYLGLLWLPLLPLADVLMRSLLFGGFLGVPSGGRPYILFLLVGTLGWVFFERATYWGYRALQYNYKYFRSMPVPWLPAVTGTVVPAALQLFLYGLIAVGVFAYFFLSQGSSYLSLGVGTLYLPVGLLLLLLFAWTLGLFLAPVVRVARDIRLFARFPLACLYVITPIVYTVQSMPPGYQAIAIYNPMTAPIELIRHSILGMPLPGETSVLVSLAFLAVTGPLGLFVFARAERNVHARL
jgi:homopolymeric O-antigen transport system permease protein